MDCNNILIMTVDCCSFDCFAKAQTPFLDKIGKAYKAEAYGTYTLPSHISIFAGYLPKCVDRNCDSLYYKRGGRQLWRLKSSRYKKPELVDIFLEGSTIIDGYNKKGYYTLGVGGVRWFKSPLLTNYFQKFIYTASEDYDDVFHLRYKNDFALNRIDCILEEIEGKENWFIFINSHETHVPYNTGERELTNYEIEILKKAKPLWGGKIDNNQESILSDKDFKVLKDLQIEAMEVVDGRIKNLVEQLPKPFIFVLMGDHGEEFGEEGLYGHGFAHKAVIEVPLLITFVN